MPGKQTLIELNRRALLQHTTVAKLLNEEQRARLLKRYYKKKEKVCLKVAEFAYQLTMFAWSMENYCADAYYEYLEEERV